MFQFMLFEACSLCFKISHQNIAHTVFFRGAHDKEEDKHEATFRVPITSSLHPKPSVRRIITAAAAAASTTTQSGNLQPMRRHAQASTIQSFLFLFLNECEKKMSLSRANLPFSSVVPLLCLKVGATQGTDHKITLGTGNHSGSDNNRTDGPFSTVRDCPFSYYHYHSRLSTVPSVPFLSQPS